MNIYINIDFVLKLLSVVLNQTRAVGDHYWPIDFSGIYITLTLRTHRKCFQLFFPNH